ncbi:MAG: hypothetical protein QXU97_03900 [Fervidicoccaceae archaeon]
MSSAEREEPQRFGVRLARAAAPPIVIGSLSAIVGVAISPFSVYRHMVLVATSVASFALALYMVSAGGFRRLERWEGLDGLLVASIASLLLVAPPLSILDARAGEASLAAASALFVVLALLAVRQERPLLRFVVLYPVVALLAVLALDLAVESFSLVELLLLYAYALMTPMITGVSLYGVAETFGAKLTLPRVLAVYPLNALGLTLAVLGEGLGYVALALSTLTHFVAVDLRGALRLLTEARKRGGLFYGTARLLVLGYVAALVGSILTVYWSVLLASGESGALFPMVHSLFIGFVGGHIYGHAAIKLPLTLALKPSRRFRPAGPACMAGAAALWPLSGELSLLLVLSSLVLLFLELDLRDAAAKLLGLRSLPPKGRSSPHEDSRARYGGRDD